MKTLGTDVKICGLTNIDDARIAASSGADLLGFIFFPKSPRYRDPDVFRNIVNTIRTEFDPAPRMVGVFVKTPVDEMIRLATHCGLDVIQMHSNESPDDAQAARSAGLDVFKVFHIEDATTIAAFDAFDVDGYLCDTPAPEEWGGTGRAFDHSLLARANKQHRLILAGGLNAGNVADAIRRVRPWGVDVASGVEAEPGRKDADAVRAFIANAKGALSE